MAHMTTVVLHIYPDKEARVHRVGLEEVQLQVGYGYPEPRNKI